LAIPYDARRAAITIPVEDYGVRILRVRIYPDLERETPYIIVKLQRDKRQAP